MEEPTRPESERFLYLDDVDRELSGKRRGNHNRLGFALEMCTARCLGLFLEDPLDVPWPVVEYLAEHLGMEDAYGRSISLRPQVRSSSLAVPGTGENGARIPLWGQSEPIDPTLWGSGPCLAMGCRQPSRCCGMHSPSGGWSISAMLAEVRLKAPMPSCQPR
ncbi:DUF4158 domain-containing protein [Streptomyces sp. HUAS TT20]|uniref:DUF4158 domain-containing protein n=1 Tax=Streptomyces sp. HUAS TT20 TaxID=3447509 RepID=UPI003988555C